MAEVDQPFRITQGAANPHQDGEYWWECRCGPLSDGGFIGLQLSAATLEDAQGLIETMYPGATFLEVEHQ